MWEAIKNILAKRLVFTIGNLLKKLKLPVFITNSSTFVKSVERIKRNEGAMIHEEICTYEVYKLAKEKGL